MCAQLHARSLCCLCPVRNKISMHTDVSTSRYLRYAYVMQMRMLLFDSPSPDLIHACLQQSELAAHNEQDTSLMRLPCKRYCKFLRTCIMRRKKIFPVAQPLVAREACFSFPGDACPKKFAIFMARQGYTQTPRSRSHDLDRGCRQSQKACMHHAQPQSGCSHEGGMAQIEPHECL